MILLGLLTLGNQVYGRGESSDIRRLSIVCSNGGAIHIF